MTAHTTALVTKALANVTLQFTRLTGSGHTYMVKNKDDFSGGLFLFFLLFLYFLTLLLFPFVLSFLLGQGKKTA